MAWHADDNHALNPAPERLRQDGLLLDLAGRCVRLRWPCGGARFPYGVAMLEFVENDWVVAQSLMAVHLNQDGTHYEGKVSLEDVGVTPYFAEGLRPEAWAVLKEDVGMIPAKYIAAARLATAWRTVAAGAAHSIATSGSAADERFVAH